jgi:hypothetical protein
MAHSTSLPERHTPFKVAMLLVLNAQAYAEEKDKEVSRYRFTVITLKRIANRQRIHASFLSTLNEELEELGWMLLIRESDYAIFDLSKTDHWVRLNSHRINDLFNKTESEVWELFAANLPEADHDVYA